MKDLLVGLSAAFTAFAAIAALWFELKLADTTSLQKKIVAKLKDRDVGKAKQLANKRRMRQKLACVGLPLVLAFVLSVAALFTSEDHTHESETKQVSSSQGM
jgi:predicted outer membrane lipoprotein